MFIKFFSVFMILAKILQN